MKPKISIFLFLLLALPAIALGQDARSILDKASNAFMKSGGAVVTFSLNTKEEKGSQTFSQSGTAYMKSNKFKIEIPDAITWFDGKTQWVYIKDTNEVNVSNPSGSELQAISPSILFSIYKQGYNLKYIGEKTVKNKVVQEVELTAQSKKNELKKVIVQIDKTNNTFSKLVLYDNNGIENTLQITSYKPNNTLTDATFSFNKKNYPNAEIIDLR